MCSRAYLCSAVDIVLVPVQQSYYSDTKAAKFLSMGFKVSTVHLAMAYRSSQGGDDNTVSANRHFCNPATAKVDS